MIECNNCGITKKKAYLTYDGRYTTSRIQTKCVKKRKKCNDEFCWTCNLDGGHIVELHGNGRHEWFGKK